MDSNKDLINKALAICEEIERRQAELRAIISSLTVEDKVVCHEVVEVEDPIAVTTVEPAETTAENEPVATEITDAATEAPEELKVAPDDKEADERSVETAATAVHHSPVAFSPVAVSGLAENQTASSSVDLRRAFTINDRFRFRRELFEGDDKAFAETVERLGRCADGDEAQAVISSFGWSADNEAAAEFREIVSNFFNGFHL